MTILMRGKTIFNGGNVFAANAQYTVAANVEAQLVAQGDAAYVGRSSGNVIAATITQDAGGNLLWESLGAKLRRLAAQAQTANAANNLTNAPWQPEVAWAATTAYGPGNVVSQSGNLYVYDSLAAAGTSGASGPAVAGFPGVGTQYAQITDGTAFWYYLGPVVTASALAGAPTFGSSGNGSAAPAGTADLYNAYTLGWNNPPAVNQPVTLLNGLGIKQIAAQQIVGISSTSVQSGYAAVYGANPSGNLGWVAASAKLATFSDSPKCGVQVLQMNNSANWQVRASATDDAGNTRYVTWGSKTAGAANNQTSRYWLDFTASGGRRFRELTFEWYSCGLMTLFGSAQDTFMPLRRTDYIRAVWFTDSFGQTWDTIGDDLVSRCGKLLGWKDNWNSYLPASGLGQQPANGLNYLQRVVDATVNCPDADICVIVGSRNDGINPSVVQANLQLMLAAIRSAKPSLPIVVIGNTPGGSSVNVAAVDTAMTAAVAAFNDSQTFYYSDYSDTPAWIIGTGYVGGVTGTGNSDFYIRTDQTHPTTAGRQYLASRIADKIRLAITRIP